MASSDVRQQPNQQSTGAPGGALEPALSAMVGFRLPLEGGRMLLRERKLWGPAAAPIAFSLAAFAIAAGLVFGYAGELYDWVTFWMPQLEAARWYAWLWIGPAKGLFGLLGVVLFIALAGLVLVAAFLVANVLAAPFLDVLSYRVELIEAGAVNEAESAGLLGSLADVLRALREELRRTGFFLGVVGVLAALGFVIPGAQIVTGPAILVFSIFFLPLDYASYALDRRRLSFRDKREWLLSNKPVVSGFGVAAFLTCLVPGLNFIAMPLLVAGGTLLALRHAPDRRALQG